MKKVGIFSTTEEDLTLEFNFSNVIEAVFVYLDKHINIESEQEFKDLRNNKEAIIKMYKEYLIVELQKKERESINFWEYVNNSIMQEKLANAVHLTLPGGLRIQLRKTISSILDNIKSSNVFDIVSSIPKDSTNGYVYLIFNDDVLDTIMVGIKGFEYEGQKIGDSVPKNLLCATDSYGDTRGEYPVLYFGSHGEIRRTLPLIETFGVVSNFDRESLFFNPPTSKFLTIEYVPPMYSRDSEKIQTLILHCKDGSGYESMPTMLPCDNPFITYYAGIL